MKRLLNGQRTLHFFTSIHGNGLRFSKRENYVCQFLQQIPNPNALFFSCRVNIRETGYEEAEIAIPVSEHNLKNKQNKLPNKDAKTSWVNNLKGKTLACFDTQEKKNKNPSKNI